MSDIKSIKRIASRLLKCGITKVWIDPERINEAKKAITREDVRKLIKQGIVKKIKEDKEKNPEAKYKAMQKKRGRRRGPGSRKGAKKAREGKKKKWMLKIRAQRKLLRTLRDKGVIDTSTYRKVYRLSKGGMFRSKKHLLTYLEENELLREKK